MLTRLQLSAECLEKWAEDANDSVEAERVLYYRLLEVLSETYVNVEAVSTLVSAMRFVGTRYRILPDLMLNEARIAKKMRERF